MLAPVGDSLGGLKDRKVSGLPSIKNALDNVGRQESRPQDAACVTIPDPSLLSDLRHGLDPTAQQFIAPAVAENYDSDQFIVKRATLVVGLSSKDDLGSSATSAHVKRNVYDLRIAGSRRRRTRFGQFIG